MLVIVSPCSGALFLCSMLLHLFGLISFQLVWVSYYELWTLFIFLSCTGTPISLLFPSLAPFSSPSFPCRFFICSRVVVRCLFSWPFFVCVPHSIVGNLDGDIFPLSLSLSLFVRFVFFFCVAGPRQCFMYFHVRMYDKKKRNIKWNKI